MIKLLISSLFLTGLLAGSVETFPATILVRNEKDTPVVAFVNSGSQRVETDHMGRATLILPKGSHKFEIWPLVDDCVPVTWIVTVPQEAPMIIKLRGCVMP